MKDIYGIKGPLYLEFRSNDILIISLILTILLFLIVYVIRWYLNALAEKAEFDLKLGKLKKDYADSIVSIRYDDPDFFFKLNRCVKNYIDEVALLPGVLFKTKKEIIRISENIAINEFAQECERYEFSRNEKDDATKEHIKEKALLIINE